MSTTERLHITPNRLSATTKAAAIALKNIIAPPYAAPDSFDRIPLKAITEVQSIEEPFKQLKLAVEIHEDVPAEDTIQTIDPVIDSASQRIHDELTEIDRRRSLDTRDPQYLNAPEGAVLVNPLEVEVYFQAYDTHHSEQTQKLAKFAAYHAATKDLRETFTRAIDYADERNIGLMDALEVARRAPSSFEPDAEQYNDEYLAQLSQPSSRSSRRNKQALEPDFDEDKTTEQVFFGK